MRLSGQPLLRSTVRARVRDGSSRGKTRRRNGEEFFEINDRIYGQGVAGFLKSCEIEEVRTADGCPWQNPFVERFGGSLRREVLDHVIVLNEAHLERLLKEYIEEFYHTNRPHQGLGGQTPEPIAKPLQQPSNVLAIPVLGGLHHRYLPVAA